MSGARPERRELVQKWISKAEEDLRAAEHLFELGEGCPFSAVCFHAQQSAEKYLKALLVWEQTPFKRVHDIEEPPLGREEAVAALQTAREIRQAGATWLPFDELPAFPSA